MKQLILQKCTIEGNVVKLPDVQLERKLYTEVAKSLELIGGKWNRKANGFSFNEDPTDLLAQIAGGEKRNLKKEFQFFGTPDALADKLVELSEAQSWHSILEPSAGQGAIVKAINRKLPNHVVDCYELMPVNRTFLEKIPTVNLIGEDFFKHNSFKYNRIIANPPFQKNQDILHIQEMYKCLKPNGRLVSMSSTHWQSCNNKQELEFRKWLGSVDAEVHEVPQGAFKESGTSIATLIIVIDKQ